MRILELGAGRTELSALPFSQFSSKITAPNIRLQNPGGALWMRQGSPRKLANKSNKYLKDRIIPSKNPNLK